MIFTDIPEVLNIPEDEDITEGPLSAGKEVLESVYFKDAEEEMADIVTHKTFTETVVEYGEDTIVPDTTEAKVVMEDDLTENYPDVVDVSESVIEDISLESKEPPSVTEAKEFTTEGTYVVIEKPTIKSSEEANPVETRRQEITEAPSIDVTHHIQDTTVTEEEPSEITETGPKSSEINVLRESESDTPAEPPSEYPAVELIPDETKPSPSEFDDSEIFIPVALDAVLETEVTTQDYVLTTTEQTDNIRRDDVPDDKPTVVIKATSEPSILFPEDAAEETPKTSDDEIEGKEETSEVKEDGVLEDETIKIGTQEEAASVEDDMGTVVESDKVIEHEATNVEILEPLGSDAKESTEEPTKPFETPAYKLEPDAKMAVEEEHSEEPGKEADRTQEHVKEPVEPSKEFGEKPEFVEESPTSQQESEVEDGKGPVIPPAPLENPELNLEEAHEDDVGETEEEGSPPDTSLNSEISDETTTASDEAVTLTIEQVEGSLPGSGVEDTSEPEEEVRVKPDEEVKPEATDRTSVVEPTSDVLESLHDSEKTIPDLPIIASPDVVPNLEETTQLDEMFPDTPHDPVLTTSPASPTEIFPKVVESTVVVLSPEHSTDYAEEPATAESTEGTSDDTTGESTPVMTVDVTPKYVVEYNNGNFPDLTEGPFYGDDGLFGNNGFDLDNEEENSVRWIHQEMLFQAM